MIHIKFVWASSIQKLCDSRHHRQKNQAITRIDELGSSRTMSEEDKVEYTNESKILAIVPKIPAFLSILGSSYIVYNVLFIQRKKMDQRNKHYHQLMLALSLSDILASHVYFLGTFLIPRGSGGPFGPVYWAFGNDRSCSYSGFFNQFAVASPIYNTMLSTYFLLKIRYGWKDRQINKIAPFLHGFPVVFALGTSFFALFRRPDTLYGNVFWTCWINPDPPQSDFRWFQWCFLFAPVWVCVIFQTIAMAFLYSSVRDVIAKSKEGSSTTRVLKTDSSSTTNHDLTDKTLPQSREISSRSMRLDHDESKCEVSKSNEDVGCDAEQQRPLDDAAILVSRDKMLQYSRTIAIQGILYVVAFYITWMFPTIQRILELADSHGKFYLQALDTSLLPLQGLFNVLIYLRPKYVSFRRKYPDLPSGIILRMVHNQADEEKLIENYTARLNEQLARLNQTSNLYTKGSSTMKKNRSRDLPVNHHEKVQRFNHDSAASDMKGHKLANDGKAVRVQSEEKCLISRRSDDDSVAPSSESCNLKKWENGATEAPLVPIAHHETSHNTVSSATGSYCDFALTPITKRLSERPGVQSHVSSMTMSRGDFDEESTSENNRWEEVAESSSQDMPLSSISKRLNCTLGQVCSTLSSVIQSRNDFEVDESVSEDSKCEEGGRRPEDMALPPIAKRLNDRLGPSLDTVSSVTVSKTDFNEDESRPDEWKEGRISQNSTLLHPIAIRMDGKLGLHSLSSLTVSQTDFEEEPAPEQSRWERGGIGGDNDLPPMAKRVTPTMVEEQPDKWEAKCPSETPFVPTNPSKSRMSRFPRVSSLEIISEVTMDSELVVSDNDSNGSPPDNRRRSESKHCFFTSSSLNVSSHSAPEVSRSRQVRFKQEEQQLKKKQNLRRWRAIEFSPSHTKKRSFHPDDHRGIVDDHLPTFDPRIVADHVKPPKNGSVDSPLFAPKRRLSES